jgi:hypothetical protein
MNVSLSVVKEKEKNERTKDSGRVCVSSSYCAVVLFVLLISSSALSFPSDVSKHILGPFCRQNCGTRELVVVGFRNRLQLRRPNFFFQLSWTPLQAVVLVEAN